MFRTARHIGSENLQHTS